MSEEEWNEHCTKVLSKYAKKAIENIVKRELEEEQK